MVYRTTFPPLLTLRREMDRLLEDTFGQADVSAATWLPAADVREETGAYRFELELPGVDPAKVEVTAEQGVLTIRGEKQRVTEGDAGKWHVAERLHGTFRRSFTLPQGVDEDRITAAFAHGVLTVLVPKAAVPKPRKIEVQATA